MKKFFALVLALVLTCALAVTCFAATAGTSEVKATYAAGATATTVHKVDVSFGAMAFTYTAESEGTWNPETHQFTNKTPAAWTCADGANVIAVTNHSNVAVNVTMSYDSADGFDDIEGAFTSASFTIESAVGKATDAAELTKTATLNLSGALAKDTNAATIGTVTVSFS